MMQEQILETIAPLPLPRRESLPVRLGPAWHKRVEGLSVLKVKGSFYEMGRQHGELLRESIASGPIPYYRDYVRRLMGRSFGPAAPAVWAVIKRILEPRVAAKLPPFALETIRGLAEGAGMPYADFREGCTMPDSLLWLASRLIGWKGVGPAVHHRLALGLGCTSAIAWGDATSGGQLLHARNLDYHGVGNWPSHGTVIFHEPDQGQRYVSVAAAGVGLGGVTAMNQAGLSLTVHQHMFTDRTALGGTPIGVMGDVVMREARNLADAERILAANRPIGCWTYLVADGNTNEVLCFEENPERNVARRVPTADSTFGYANIYLDEELGATEKNLYGSYWRHNLGRHQRANHLLKSRPGRLGPQQMADIIGHRGDPRCRLRDSIAMLMTVGSVVFRPGDGTFWVGSGEAPTSRGRFVPFRLESEDHAPEAGSLQTSDGERPEERDAFEQLRLAYIAYVDAADTGAARDHLDRARRLAPEQALYHSLYGLTCLERGDAPASAEQAFSAAIQLGHPDPERVASFHLWRGRARDRLGRRKEAVTDYRAALGHQADRPVHVAAARGLKKAWRGNRLLNIDFAFADVITP